MYKLVHLVLVECTVLMDTVIQVKNERIPEGRGKEDHDEEMEEDERR